MKKLLLVCFACTLLVCLAAAQSTKQDNSATQDTAKTNPQDKQAEKPAKGTKTVTGCLQKGDEAGEFSIVGEDGKLWGLRSSTVKLQDHVGHKVTVTGTASRESKAEAEKEKKEGQVENAAQKEEYGDLRVTSLKMVSDTCAK
jgi:hypothetical protein